MKRNCVFLLLLYVIVALLVTPQQLRAGAWGRNKGEFFLSLQPYYYSTDIYYDRHGHKHDRGGPYTKYELNPYMEYGVTEKDTIILNIFYDWLTDRTSDGKKQNQGFVDQEIGWQHQFYGDGVAVFAVQGLCIIPSGYNIEDDPRLGYGRFGGEISLLYGRSYKLLDHYGFVDLRVGFRDYVGYPSSQLRPMVTIGYDIFSQWQILAAAELHYGLNNGTEKILGPNLLAQPNYRLLKLSLAARYRLNDQCSLVAGGYGHAWGEETGGGGGAYVSLWYTY